MFNNYKNLGFHSKYFSFKGINLVLSRSFQEAVSNLDKKSLDVTAVIEFVNRFYFFSDRTLVNQLYKTPWLAKPNTTLTDWLYYKPTDEIIKISSEDEFAAGFISRVEKEIISYIGHSEKTGILLTGGMDSRIVAALVHKLNKKSKINTKVIAYTWGMPHSRDVVYASRIAKKYGWDFKSFELSAAILKKNIIATANEGCEFSPVHLHGMMEIATLKDVDVILAGSFGDSIGRAEYSGSHASKLTSLGDGITNKFFFINEDLFKKHATDVQKDIKYYASLFPRKQTYSNFEIEQMAHYMRKELNPCMSIIDKETPLFQVFSAPEVYNFVLNVPLEYRNDRLYYNVLKTVDSELLNIPWARTGKLYLQEASETDTVYTKDYHDYAKWIRQDLYDYIEGLICNGELEKLGVFNMKAIKFALEKNKSLRTKSTNRIDELLVWLASLALMLEQQPLEGSENNSKNDTIVLLKSKLKITIYLLGTKIKSYL